MSVPRLQVVDGAGAGAPAITNPAGGVPGRVSTSPIPVKSRPEVLVIVMVRVE